MEMRHSLGCCNPNGYSLPLTFAVQSSRPSFSTSNLADLCCFPGQEVGRDDLDHHPEPSELLLLQLLIYKLSSSGKGGPRQLQRNLSPLAETTLAPQSHQRQSPCECGNSSPCLLVH